MLLCVPVSLSDRKLIETVEKSFEIFPPGSGHKLLVVGGPSVYGEVHEAAQRLSRFFAGAAATFLFEMDNNEGWPTACNFYAQQTAFYLQNFLRPEEQWLWFELDTTPVRSNWLDDISRAVDQQYVIAARENRPRPLYFGVREPTRLGEGGNLMPAAEAGEHMAAVGVYSAILASQALTIRTVAATNVPWYVFIRWYVAYDYFAPLALIQNNWRTANYERSDGGKIVCDSVVNWAWDIHFNQDIAPETVLVHGCKDGSLMELLAFEHESMKEEGIPVEEYWTDAPEEELALEAAVAGGSKPKRSKSDHATQEKVRAGRQRLLALHEKRRAERAEAT
jgi:hypothetical protein